MNKKALYEAIMKDISKIVKKKINENMEENTINIPSQYYDEDGDIDLSDLSVLPKNIIKALVNDLLKNGVFKKMIEMMIVSCAVYYHILIQKIKMLLF